MGELRVFQPVDSDEDPVLGHALASFRARRVPDRILSGFTEDVMAQVNREVQRSKPSVALWRAAAVMGLALLLAASMIGRAPDRVPEVAHHPPSSPRLLELKTPVAQLYVNDEAQVVFMVLDHVEEL